MSSSRFRATRCGPSREGRTRLPLSAKQTDSFPAVEAPVVRAAVVVAEPLPEAPLPQLQPDASLATTAIAVATVLRSIAVADRRFSREEKELLDEVVRELAAGDSRLESALRTLLPELRSDPANLADALTWLSSCDATTQRRVIELAETDGTG